MPALGRPIILKFSRSGQGHGGAGMGGSSHARWVVGLRPWRSSICFCRRVSPSPYLVMGQLLARPCCSIGEKHHSPAGGLGAEVYEALTCRSVHWVELWVWPVDLAFPSSSGPPALSLPKEVTHSSQEGWVSLGPTSCSKCFPGALSSMEQILSFGGNLTLIAQLVKNPPAVQETPV